MRVLRFVPHAHARRYSSLRFYFVAHTKSDTTIYIYLFTPLSHVRKTQAEALSVVHMRLEKRTFR